MRIMSAPSRKALHDGMRSALRRSQWGMSWKKVSKTGLPYGYQSRTQYERKLGRVTQFSPTCGTAPTIERLSVGAPSAPLRSRPLTPRFSCILVAYRLLLSPCPRALKQQMSVLRFPTSLKSSTLPWIRTRGLQNKISTRIPSRRHLTLAFLLIPS